MARITKVIALAALAGAMAFGQSASAAEDKDVIEYRERIMKTLQEQTATIGMIVSTQIPPDNLVQHAEAIALAAKIALKSFEAKVPGGEAKPEVWTKWDDFSKRMKTFEEKSQAMADAAKKGAGISEITEMLVDALPCKDCHDIYRAEKK
jgi:cytochrome c556